MAAYETIRAEREGEVLTLTMAREDRLNALSPAMADELSAALDDLGGARCVVLTGAGRAFCAGADLQALPQSGPRDLGDGARDVLERSYNPLVERLMHLPVPLVAAVNGAAAGIGCSLALTADFVVAAREGYFLQAFINIGLVPDGGASWLLPRLVGRARAARMLMLGERISAQTAAEWGLIHACVDGSALHTEVMALAGKLAAGPTRALAATRALLLGAEDATLAAQLAAEAATQHAIAASVDAREGVAAFLARRPATFTGR